MINVNCSNDHIMNDSLINNINENSNPISIKIESPNYEYVHGKKFNVNPQWIVVHYTACVNVSAKSMCKSMRNNKDASTHFYVDENDICAAVPLNYIAWHVGDGKCKQPDSEYKKSLKELSTYKTKDWRYDLAATNHLKWQSENDDFLGNKQSIGVDICVKKKSNKTKKATDTDWYFEDKAIDNAAKLIAYLAKKYDIKPNHIIRHGDATGKLCLPVNETEILTPNGFISLNDINVGDDVYQYNLENESAEITKVLSKVEPYTTLVCKNKTFEATADHRVLVKVDDKATECQFKDLFGKRFLFILSCNNINNIDINITDNQLRFLILVHCSGTIKYDKDKSCNYITFCVQNEARAENLKSIIESLGLTYEHTKPVANVQRFDVLYDNVKSIVDTYLTDNLLNANILKISKRQFEVVYDEFNKFRLTRTKSNVFFTSQRKSSVDIIQALFAINGIDIVEEYKSRVHTLKLANKLSLFGNNVYSFFEKQVSCIEVPSSYIIIRQSGHTFITGNCPRPFVSIPSDNTGDENWNNFKKLIDKYTSTEIIVEK